MHGYQDDLIGRMRRKSSLPISSNVSRGNQTVRLPTLTSERLGRRGRASTRPPTLVLVMGIFNLAFQLAMRERLTHTRDGSSHVSALSAHQLASLHHPSSYVEHRN